MLRRLPPVGVEFAALGDFVRTVVPLRLWVRICGAVAGNGDRRAGSGKVDSGFWAGVDSGGTDFRRSRRNSRIISSKEKLPSWDALPERCVTASGMGWDSFCFFFFFFMQV